MTPPINFVSPTGQRIVAASPLTTDGTTGGQLTRHALHIANDTITRMGQQAIALRHELSAARDTITELTQDNEILRGELDRARRMSQP